MAKVCLGYVVRSDRTLDDYNIPTHEYNRNNKKWNDKSALNFQ